MDNTFVLGQGEGSKLAPTVVEARGIGVVLAPGREQVGDVLGGDTARAKGGMAFRRERVGIESYQRIARVDGAQRVVECEEAREIAEIGDEGCPD